MSRVLFDAYLKIKVDTERNQEGLHNVYAGEAWIGHWSEYFLGQQGIELPKPIAVGDEVTWDNNVNSYSVIAIDGDMAFVKCEIGPCYAMKEVKKLRRAK